MSTNTTYFTHLPTSRIKPNPFNPRKVFDPDGIRELAASIDVHGLLQPLIVYKEETYFILICGERRLRAAQEVALNTVPAIVYEKAPEDQSILSMMLVENLQRKEVDMISESTAIRRLVEEHDWSIAKVSRNLGAGIGFVRNRFLLTRFSDVLEAYTTSSITFSEAIELATIEDAAIRRWFFNRMSAGEISDHKSLSAAVARDRSIRSLMEDPASLQRPLDRAHIEFEVKGLSYCDPNCPHYRRLTWDEKQEYKLAHDRPGWAEFCAEKGGKCYQQKVAARQAKLVSLRRVKFRRPISDSDATPMFWLTLDRLSCQKCKWMVKAVELEEVGEPLPQSIHAVCSCPSSKCYDKRLKTLERRATQIQAEATRMIALNHDHLHRNANDAGTSTLPAGRAQLTKRECVYILLQFLTHHGGEPRLEDFADRRGWAKYLPAQRNAKVSFLRNKLLHDLPEEELHAVLLDEAFLSAGYSQAPFPALKFIRANQTTVPISQRRK